MQAKSRTLIGKFLDSLTEMTRWRFPFNRLLTEKDLPATVDTKPQHEHELPHSEINQAEEQAAMEREQRLRNER